MRFRTVSWAQGNGFDAVTILWHPALRMTTRRGFQAADCRGSAQAPLKQKDRPKAVLVGSRIRIERVSGRVGP